MEIIIISSCLVLSLYIVRHIEEKIYKIFEKDEKRLDK